MYAGPKDTSVFINLRAFFCALSVYSGPYSFLIHFFLSLRNASDTGSKSTNTLIIRKNIQIHSSLNWSHTFFAAYAVATPVDIPAIMAASFEPVFLYVINPLVIAAAAPAPTTASTSGAS